MPVIGSSLGAAPDASETCRRLGATAERAVQRAASEGRIVGANDATVQVNSDAAKQRPLQDFVGVFRVPDQKGAPGWRGPIDPLDIDLKENAAIAMHLSMPRVVPLRHARPRVARPRAPAMARPPARVLMDGEGSWQGDLRENLRTALPGLLGAVDGRASCVVAGAGVLRDDHG